MDTEIPYENYIIAHHIMVDDGTGRRGYKTYRIPQYPTDVSDTMDSKYVATEILARSAPIQSWANSGPRKVSFTLEVHRDMDWDGEYPNEVKIGDIGELMDTYQALELPNYEDPMRVKPPLVTVNIGKGIRITGVPSISFTHKGTLDENGIYQQGEFSISIVEVDPYDAVSVTSIKNNRGRLLEVNK